MINTSDAYSDEIYSEPLSKIMFSINSLIYSQYFTKKALATFTNDELDILMDNFIEEISSVDIYDFKFRNHALLNYDLEDKLSNIKAKTLVANASDDCFYSPEFDVYPLKEKIENLENPYFRCSGICLQI